MLSGKGCSEYSVPVLVQGDKECRKAKAYTDNKDDDPCHRDPGCKVQDDESDQEHLPGGDFPLSVPGKNPSECKGYEKGREQQACKKRHPQEERNREQNDSDGDQYEDNQ